jgi:hypothetical protein
MSEHVVRTPESLLRTYFHAKDENRPHLIQSVFCEEAVLEMNVKTDSISFPAVSRGVAAIAQVLVSKFAQSYENVYSFYLQRPPMGVTTFACDWLVGMSEKASNDTRVGCGRYDWSFQREAPHLVNRLVITIEAMQVLPADRLPHVLNWLLTLPYPWCSANAAYASAPVIESLAPVLKYIGRDVARA